ncbi:MAG: hypothetical protein ABF743_00975 [Schleiferilactobacillus perolens]|uniref:hypothetical protein n=1 Tax=Schleiferilactobacillus perolens TaxID=100468 RepID=UPI0039E964BD
MNRRTNTTLKIGVLLVGVFGLGLFHRATPVQAANSTAQFTVIVDDTSIPKGDETLPESHITTEDEGKIPQLDEQHSPLLAVVGLELIILTGLASWQLRDRRRSQ